MRRQRHFLIISLALGLLAVTALSPKSDVTASSIKPTPKHIEVNGASIQSGQELGTWDFTVDLEKEEVQVKQVYGRPGIKVAALLGAPNVTFSSPSSIYNNSVLVNAPFNRNPSNPTYASLSLNIQILNQTGQPLGQSSPTDATKISGVDLLLVPRSDCSTGTPSLSQPICVISNTSQRLPKVGASGRNDGTDPVYVAYMTPRDGSNLTVGDDVNPPEWKDATAFTNSLNYARSIWRSDLRIPNGGAGTFGVRFRYAQDSGGNGKPRVTQFTYRMRILADHPNGGPLVAGKTYVTSLAGSFKTNYADGIGSTAAFSIIPGVAVSPDGTTLYVASNNRIRAINLAKKAVTTLAGNGVAAYADGIGTAASFSSPSGVVVNPDGTTLYVTSDNRIRAINLTTKAVTTLAGNGVAAYVDGIGTAASFSSPSGVVVNPDGTTLYVTSDNRIRAINLTTKVVTTLAGNGVAAYADGIGTAASFNGGYWGLDLAVSPDGTTLYVADVVNNRIRAINLATKAITTLAGSGLSYSFPPGDYSPTIDGIGTAASFSSPRGIKVSPDSSTVYVTDWFGQPVRAINLATKSVTTPVAGRGLGSEDTSFPDLAVSPDGTSVYLAETYFSDSGTFYGHVRTVHTIEGQGP